MNVANLLGTTPLMCERDNDDFSSNHERAEAFLLIWKKVSNVASISAASVSKHVSNKMENKRFFYENQQLC